MMKNTHDRNFGLFTSTSRSMNAQRYVKSAVSDIGISGGPDIFNRLLDERIVLVSGELDEWLCEYVKTSTLYLETISDDDIKYYVNSPGGSVYYSLGVLDVMEFVRPDIITVNTGLAASMGAVLLCSGTKGKRRSLRRARVMIHQPLAFGSFVQQASDMEIEAREINSLKRELYEIISEKSGQPYEKVYMDGDRDYWMTAQDALAYGMIDEIIIPEKNKS
jgi:ATP-dependent Clp protease protease subunit